MPTAPLTPTTDPAPAIVNVTPELSGPQWVSRFPGSNNTASLEQNFRQCVEAFIHALRTGGAHVTISATYRPPQRSYLMHWCWMIKHGTNPATVPPLEDVNIEWVHPTAAASLAAAREMASAYGMNNLHTPPALHSNHNVRKAVDMGISWTGSVSVEDAGGNLVNVTTTPRTGMNAKIIQVGASYGVIKYVGGANDKPHWSTDGH